jgi:hypothetical protein
LRLGRLAIAVVALGPLGHGLGCAVDALELDGKRCPCAVGFVCDTRTDRCVAEGTAIADAMPPRPDEDEPAPPPPPDASVAIDASGKIDVFELRSTWQTANGVRWDWKVVGNAEDFDRYELVIGPTAEEVRARGPNTKVFDRTMNVELGMFGGRVAAPAERPFTTWTVTDGLAVETTVFAQVLAFDKEGKVSSSEIPSAITPRPRAVLPVYEDAIPDNGMLTAGTTTSTQMPFVGTQCLTHPISCGGPATCLGTTGILSILGKSTSTMDVTDFDRAFLELAVRGAPAPGVFADLVLALGADVCGTPCRMRFAGITTAAEPGEWRLVQVPLRMMKRDDGTGANLNYAELGARNHRVNGFLVYGTWPSGIEIGLDQARIRW